MTWAGEQDALDLYRKQEKQVALEVQIKRLRVERLLASNKYIKRQTYQRRKRLFDEENRLFGEIRDMDYPCRRPYCGGLFWDMSLNKIEQL